MRFHNFRPDGHSWRQQARTRQQIRVAIRRHAPTIERYWSPPLNGKEFGGSNYNGLG